VFLDQAYSHPDNVVVKGDTMYIAGTHSMRDVITDISIPFGMIERTERYRQARDILAKNPDVTTVVGHSLGGIIAEHLVKNSSHLSAVSYSAPSISNYRNVEYRRNYLDPISGLNISAASTRYSLRRNPHGY